MPSLRQASPLQPERLHPSLWRGTQLAAPGHRCVPTGHDVLSAQLPGGGWPMGTLVELLPTQPGIGELRLLLPVLRNLGAQRPVALLQPPYRPHAASWTAAGVSASQLLWLKPDTSTDALWAADQILKNGSCGALLFWQPQVRPESLRRLHLAAQSADTLFFLFRPASVMREASPAPLRLLLEPAGDTLQARVIKRRGPAHDQPIQIDLGKLYLPANTAISAGNSDALMDQRASDTAQPRRFVPELA